MSQSQMMTNGIAFEGEETETQVLIPKSLDDDIRLWNLEDVGRFLRLSGFEELVGLSILALQFIFPILIYLLLQHPFWC